MSNEQIFDISGWPDFDADTAKVIRDRPRDLFGQLADLRRAQELRLFTRALLVKAREAMEAGDFAGAEAILQDGVRRWLALGGLSQPPS